MTKTMTAAAIVALSLALAPTVHAEGTTVRAAETMSQMKPGDMRASKFIGSTVYDLKNEKVGEVKELVFDRSGRIDQAVVDVGTFLGMGGKLVAVGMRDIKTDNNRLTLDVTKERLKAAPEYKYRETESTGSSMPNTGPARRN